MPRILVVLLCFSFLLTPISAGAQESQEPTESAEVPVYLFIAENGDVLGLVPITEEVAVGCLAASKTSENPKETSETPKCFLLILSPALSTAPQTPEAGVERSIFTGQEYDEDTNLHYYVQRYYAQDIARFTSQDPVFLAIGDHAKIKEQTQLEQQKLLEDPQRYNSYSYVTNNPLRYVDPKGETYWELNAGVDINPYSANIGLKVDFENLRMDFTYGGGASLGAAIDLTFMYSSDDLPEENSYLTTNAEVTAAYGIAAKGALSNTYTSLPSENSTFDAEVSPGVGAGLGISTSVGVNHNFTLIDYSKDTNLLNSIQNALTNLAQQVDQFQEDLKKRNNKNKDKKQNDK